MTESRVFNLDDGINAESVGHAVESFLRDRKKLTTEGTVTPDGYFVQAKEQEATWKKIAGMSMAIQVQIIQIENTITVNIGNGQWSDKIGAGVAGAVLFAPLAVTAAIGAINQKRLPGEIFEHIEKFIMSGGKSVAVSSLGQPTASNDQIFCPNCKAVNQKGAKFCDSCGTPLSATCPNCNASVELDKKFCPECGSPIQEEESEKTCPECGATIEEGKKFCGECGTPIPEEESEKTCPECGATIEEGKKFCGECGTKVE